MVFKGRQEVKRHNIAAEPPLLPVIRLKDKNAIRVKHTYILIWSGLHE